MVEHLYTNRLISEKSPYLQQHAHNPVDWYPWGDEAFDTAQQLDKPIFLSIGYATCHWCHVMERESFENVELAKQMNETFVNVKVDREELPQVDALYMDFAQAMLGGGIGWPLNVVLTPELKPIFVATYLPSSGQRNQLGMTELMRRIKELWSSDQREHLIEQADEIVQAVEEQHPEGGDDLPGKAHLEAVAEIFYQMADPLYGGLQGAPKFPMGFQISLMLRIVKYTGDSRALFYVQKTLDHMQRGGIYDHLGGGFARYSVDEEWMVPHFEKMLYDNALLIKCYCEAWQLTHDQFYRTISEEICNYILRDMTHAEGGFYAAEDAESEGHEGRFYTWTVKEIEESLGREDAELFCDFYNVFHEGNFDGRNILYIRQRPEEFIASRSYADEPKVLEANLARMRTTLWKKREERARPFKDEKIITAWNGLMIHALAEAGVAFDRPEYIQAAAKAAQFIKKNLWKGGRLLRRWCRGEAKHAACLDDYVFLISGLLSLFKVDNGTLWLQWAQELAKICRSDFKSPDGPFYMTEDQDPHLLLRKIDLYDGAEPSGNAVHCENLIRLYQITYDKHYLEQAEDILKAAKPFLEQHPLAGCYHCMALQRYVNKRSISMVIALPPSYEGKKEIESTVGYKFAPHIEPVWRHDNDELLWDIIPATKDQGPQDNQPALYVCYDGMCQAPVVGKEEILAAIRKL